MSIAFPIPRGTRQVVPDYLSDGVTTAYPFPFYLINSLDLWVGVSQPGETGWRALTLGADYTIDGVGLAAGVVANLAAPQPANTLIRLKGLRTPSRTTSVVNDGTLMSGPFEQELDAVELTMQELRRDIDLVSLRNGTIGRVPIFDANYDCTPLDRMIAFVPFGGVGLTAAHTVLLALAASVPPNTRVTFCDETAQCSAIYTLTALANGTDTIAGLPQFGLAAAYGCLDFISNGKNLWLVK